jgi:hypothetical protein
LITLRVDYLSEQALAEIALAIQNRWNVATFVKMHEIIVMDDDDEVDYEGSGKVITAAIDPKDIERGMRVIMQNLDLDRAFELQRNGKNNLKLKLVDPTQIPKWVEKATSDLRQPPEGVYECPHCVLPNSLILGDNKPITECRPGNLAIGLTGLNPIIKVLNRSYKGEIVTVKPDGMLPLIITPEHPILVTTSKSLFKKVGNQFDNEILFSEPKWIEAGKLVPKITNSDGNYLAIPIIRGTFESYEISMAPFIKKRRPTHAGFGEFFPLTEDTAWLLGLFIANGSIAKEIRFSLNKNQEQIKERIIVIAKRLGYSVYVHQLQSTDSMLVTISSRVLARAMDKWCGHKAHNKTIPDFILFHRDENILRSFLRGYEAGDGYDRLSKSGGNKLYKTCVTTSQILAQQLQLAYVRLGIWARIRVRKWTETEFIMGSKCPVQVRYDVSYALEPNEKWRRVRFLKDMVLCSVRNISKSIYVGNVYNLTTGDGTYLISNVIVHNCGRRFSNELEMSMHTKLHYII